MHFSIDLNYFTASTSSAPKFCIKWRVSHFFRLIERPVREDRATAAAATHDDKDPVQVPSPPAPRSKIGVRGTPERDIFSWVREGKGPGQDPCRHESSSPPLGNPKKLIFTNGTLNKPNKNVRHAILCRISARSSRKQLNNSNQG